MKNLIFSTQNECNFDIFPTRNECSFAKTVRIISLEEINQNMVTKYDNVVLIGENTDNEWRSGEDENYTRNEWRRCENHTRNEWRRCENTHSKRVEKM